MKNQFKAVLLLLALSSAAHAEFTDFYNHYDEVNRLNDSYNAQRAEESQRQSDYYQNEARIADSEHRIQQQIYQEKMYQDVTRNLGHRY